MEVLVAGLGNEYRSDDGAGPAVAAYVSERMSKVVSKVISEPLDLIGAWDDVDLAVVVDATRSGSQPGTVQLVDLGRGEDPASSAGPMSSHGMDLPRCSGSRSDGPPSAPCRRCRDRRRELRRRCRSQPSGGACSHASRGACSPGDRRGELMCMSRLHRAVTAPAGGWMTVENAEGRLHRVSLIALRARSHRLATGSSSTAATHCGASIPRRPQR